MHPRGPTNDESLFAEYVPRAAGDARAIPPAGLALRASTRGDVDALARIRAERDGGDPATYVVRFARDLANCPAPPDDLWLTAVLDGAIVGYAKVASFAPPADAPANVAPAGYYLGGVTVRRDARRRGIGAALTAARLDWISERARMAYYVANAANRASIDLHARFGFVEVTRDFWFPGVTGVLSRVDLTSRR
jgi:GNAT superfamily N-acetyltransferase